MKKVILNLWKLSNKVNAQIKAPMAEQPPSKASFKSGQ